jgi:uncharacterized protein YjbJ (UPF0337 family)
MKNRDELDGKVEQVKGGEAGLGDLTNNEEVHDEGVADEAAGTSRKGFGRAKRKVGEFIEDSARHKEVTADRRSGERVGR